MLSSFAHTLFPYRDSALLNGELIQSSHTHIRHMITYDHEFISHTRNTMAMKLTLTKKVPSGIGGLQEIGPVEMPL